MKRVYLRSKPLGQAIATAMEKMGKTQKTAAKELNVTQGQISHLVAGDFKTKNDLVTMVCKYANIDPDTFRANPAPTAEVDREALAALGRACGGHKAKTAAVIRVLRALEDLSPIT